MIEQSTEEYIPIDSGLSEYAAPIQPNAPVILSWQDLVVSTKDKRLLKNVSGQITGGFWAIMGSSGSGKTTLMSTLALRLNPTMNISGELRMNGRKYVKHELKNMSGYVMQDDLLDGNFTVQETLHYTAILRMSADTTPSQRQTRINLALRLLDIVHVRDVFVGDSRRKGVSGGERKRLCIAMELLSRPKLLFLDEPTSGLDAHTALLVMRIMKRIAMRGVCTVVTTIHQPSSQVFALCDSLLLLSRGRIVYQGQAKKVLTYFDRLGFPCPEHTNPADHVIFVLASDPALKERRKLPNSNYSDTNNCSKPANNRTTQYNTSDADEETADASTKDVQMRAVRVLVPTEEQVEDAAEERCISDNNQDRNKGELYDEEGHSEDEQEEGAATTTHTDSNGHIKEGFSVYIEAADHSQSYSNSNASNKNIDSNNTAITKSKSTRDISASSTMTFATCCSKDKDKGGEDENYFSAEANVFLLPIDLSLGTDRPEFPVPQRLSWLRQWLVLVQRAMQAHLRRWDVLLLNLAVTLLIAGFVCASVWRDIGTGKASASRRQPALFFCVIHQGIVASLQGTHSFPLERSLMLRERATGAYTVSAYFLGKTVADMVVMQILSPLLFSVVVYPAIGFSPTASQFFIFLVFMVLTSMAATSLANLAACLCVGVERATVLLAAAYEISRLYGAWFISPKLLVDYSEWRFADTLSYIKYSFVGVSLNENQHLMLNCAPQELTRTVNSVDGSVTYSCVIPPLNKPPYTGDAFNEYYGYNQFTIGGCVGALILYIVVCRILAYLALRYIKH